LPIDAGLAARISDAGARAQMVTAFATNISPGPPDEFGQTSTSPPCGPSATGRRAVSPRLEWAAQTGGIG